jgi:hypothetical protein
MIVSGRDSGIEMVAIELMIGMIVMAQTRSQCLSSSGINEEKADQASSESSHGNNWFYLRLCTFSRHGIKNVPFKLL